MRGGPGEGRGPHRRVFDLDQTSPPAEMLVLETPLTVVQMDRAEHRARTDFYKRIQLMTRDLLAAEAEWFGL